MGHDLTGPRSVLQQVLIWVNELCLEYTAQVGVSLSVPRGTELSLIHSPGLLCVHWVWR